MAGNLSDFGEALLLKWLMTAQAATRPSTWYVALFSADPGEATGGTELSGNNYSRQTASFGTTGATNDADIGPFVNNTVTDWAKATHIAIFDASTSGNRLWHGPLSVAKTVEAGDTLTIPTGELDLSLD